MNVYTFSEARQNLASVLDKASKDGEVCIRRKDGKVFTIKPKFDHKSPFDVPGVDTGITRDEIVDMVRRSRERG